MTLLDYTAVCRWGHRTFLRLDLLSHHTTVMGRCGTCGEPGRLTPVVYVAATSPASEELCELCEHGEGAWRCQNHLND